MCRSKGEFSHASSLGVNIATLGVAIGVAVMIVSIAVVYGFKNEIKNKVTGFGADIQVVNSDGIQAAENGRVVYSKKFFEDIGHVDGVKHIQKITQKTCVFKTDDEFKGVVLYGIGDDFDNRFISSHMLYGTMPRFTEFESLDAIVISNKIAKELDLKVGDRVFSYFFDNDIKTRRFFIKGIYETNLSLFDDNVIYANINVVNRLNGWGNKDCSNIEITVDDFNQNEEIADRIADVLPEKPDVNGCFYAVYSIAELFGSIFDWLKLLDLNIWVILALMTCVCCFTIISGLLILILEKTSTIGLLKAVGARSGLIRKIYVFYGMYIICKGLILGNVVGLTLSFLQYKWHIVGLDPSSYYVDFIPISFNWEGLLFLNFSTLFLGCLILYIPTVIIAHIKPVSVLKFD